MTDDFGVSVNQDILLEAASSGTVTVRAFRNGFGRQHTVFCALVFSVLFGQVTAESTIAGAVIGYLSAKAEQVTAYYFGSSAGSKAKTDFMAKR